ncbi:hypothetical protein BD410DRAFT_307736 [Rickenella mellea]|uniref:Jacalin-type lectin domain-containing protein n=1 Tax=Rickenella mellea TaxID=50990 RepID=A0A4Y7Q0K6_9AGAM|nr:hypothetical protein BD410DRAFT_307736 [Rickenella mellea]
MQSHMIDFSDGEVLVEVNGFVKGVIFEMSFVILNTRTNAKRVDGPFGNGHAVDWLPKDCIGNRFIFRMDGRHIIAFGGRYDPVNPCRLTGLTFIHCPL